MTGRHYLQKVDPADIVAPKPELLIVGTGAHGVMTLPESTMRFLEDKRIDAEDPKTAEAVYRVNCQTSEASLPFT